MSNTAKTEGPRASIGVLSVFFLMEATFILTPALALLAEKYPDMPYSMITMLSTIPNLIGIPMGIISGALIKKGMKYKALISLAIVLVIVGGIIPYFITSFGGWMFARCLFGVGFGICVPMSSTMVGVLFSGQRAARIQGIGGTIQNLSGVILQLLSGYICLINVDFAWLLHLIFIIPLVIFLICCPEPNRQEGVLENSTAEKKPRAKLPARVWLVSAAYGLSFMFLYPYLLNMSAILTNEGIGNAGLAGIISSVYTVGGMVAGVAFPFFKKGLGSKLNPVLYIGTAAGLFIGYFGHNAVVLCVAGFIGGMTLLMLWPAHVVDFADYVEPDSMAMANGIFAGAINLFAFLASFFIQLVAMTLGADPRMPIIVGAIGVLIIGIIFAVTSVTGKKK